MADMTRRDQELQGLHELRRNQGTLKSLEKKRANLVDQLNSVDGDAAYEARESFRWLDDSNASEYRWNLDKKIEKTQQRKQNSLNTFCCVANVLLGVLMVILLILNGGVELGDYFAKTHIFDISLLLSIFTIVVSFIGCFIRNTKDKFDRIGTAIMLILLLVALAIVAHMITFSGRTPALWTILLSVVMGVIAGLTLLPLIIVLVASVWISFWAMIAIQNYLMAIPILMIVLSILSVFVRVKKREYTKKEKQLLSEKQALDAHNKQINDQNYAVASRKIKENYKERRNVISGQLSTCKSEIAAVKAKIQNNGWLYGDDIQWADKVADYIQSRRADSIKEALRLVDMELERERQRKLDEQRHKEIMEELEYQSWEAANARAEQREAAERAEKALRESEAAAERARYDAEMRAYEENWKADQHRQNVEWELRKMRDDG